MVALTLALTVPGRLAAGIRQRAILCTYEITARRGVEILTE
jgi:hypothetical protein